MKYNIYSDHNLFEHEWKSIIKKQWIFVALFSDFPLVGDQRSYQVLNENIFLVRDKNGVNAFHNICPHRGSKICVEEKINSLYIECPYHRWRFDLDGGQISSRGYSECQKRINLRRINLKMKWGLIFISFGGEEFVLEEKSALFNTLFESYNISGTSAVEEFVMNTQTNWKLFIENFLECYHCAPNHPELRSMEQFIDSYENSYKLYSDDVPRLGSLKGLNVLDWKSEMPAFARIAKLKDGILSETRYGKLIGPILGGPEHKLAYVIYGMFGPFFHFTLNADHVVLFTFIPIDANTTRVTIRWCVLNFLQHVTNIEELTWLWKSTIQQDINLTEQVQKNAASEYFPEPNYHLLENDAKLFMLWCAKYTNTNSC